MNKEELLKRFKFGDYVKIEQKRYGVPNEHYVHKVIGALESNLYMDVPAQTHLGMTLHDEVVPVLQVICCGVSEDSVIRVRVEDCQPYKSTPAVKHQELSAAIQDALAEAKKRFEPRDGGYHARFRKPRYTVTRKGIRCSAEQYAPQRLVVVSAFGATMMMPAEWRKFSTTYTWEELLP